MSCLDLVDYEKEEYQEGRMDRFVDRSQGVLQSLTDSHSESALLLDGSQSIIEKSIKKGEWIVLWFNLLCHSDSGSWRLRHRSASDGIQMTLGEIT